MLYENPFTDDLEFVSEDSDYHTVIEEECFEEDWF